MRLFCLARRLRRRSPRVCRPPATGEGARPDRGEKSWVCSTLSPPPSAVCRGSPSPCRTFPATSRTRRPSPTRGSIRASPTSSRDSTPSKQVAGGVIANSQADQQRAGRDPDRLVRHRHGDQRRRLFSRQVADQLHGHALVFGGVDLYTRRGDFQLDANGYLVNGGGYYLEGVPIDPTTGNPIGTVAAPLQFQNNFLPAAATTQINTASTSVVSADPTPTTTDTEFRAAQSRRLLRRQSAGGRYRHRGRPGRHDLRQ